MTVLVKMNRMICFLRWETFVLKNLAAAMDFVPWFYVRKQGKNKVPPVTRLINDSCTTTMIYFIIFSSLSELFEPCFESMPWWWEKDLVCFRPCLLHKKVANSHKTAFRGAWVAFSSKNQWIRDFFVWQTWSKADTPWPEVAKVPFLTTTSCFQNVKQIKQLASTRRRQWNVPPLQFMNHWWAL
jgi:hypothetical protein